MKNENGKKTWLLNWNPAYWDWEDYKDLCIQTKNGQPYEDGWRSQSKKPAIGDTVFLIKTGADPRGIVGHGFVVKESHTEAHYNPDKAAEGKTTNFIDVSFDRLLDYEKETFIAQEELKEKIPNQEWSPQASGIEIKEPGATQLKDMWETLVGENYIPVLSEYDPGISKDDYKKYLADGSIVNYNWLDTVYCLFEMGKGASCKEIEIEYGKTASHYIINATNTAKAIQKETDCPIWDEDGNSKYWPILFVGKYTDSMQEGVFEWKLRDPLEDAIAELEAEGFFARMKEIIMNYKSETNQEKYTLEITADSVTSTDERFSMDDLQGKDYKPIDVYFEKSDGEVIRRKRKKNEQTISNKTLPRLSCQIFEKQIAGLSVEEKEQFPVCQYNQDSKLICGIFSSVDEYQRAKNTSSYGYCRYYYDNGREFVIHCWSVFSTIMFVQECLKRFGEPGDKFVLIYRDKEAQEMEADNNEPTEQDHNEKSPEGYMNPFSTMLIESKNIIFRGAPGTGKTYLAKEIATDIISDGYFNDYKLLSEEQKQQIGFVQFHPSYDYSDFVEGLRPIDSSDGTVGFGLRDGVFKKFVDRARKNYEDSMKSMETIEREQSAQELITNFFSDIEFGIDEFHTVTGNIFTVTSVDDKHINISIPGNANVNKLSLKTAGLKEMLESDKTFTKVKDVTEFFGKTFASQEYSYDFALYQEISSMKSTAPKTQVKQEKLKKYIFIIDEINRGEISKIFGELFFSIDPGYRGKEGEVFTQYANLHDDPNEKFYVPENVYIIGTMNDIDRSVDSFDFAMRRRFRFIELKANEQTEMLANLNDEELADEAMERMIALNKAIADTPDLDENYQIGASYYLKVKTIGFDQLWTDYLQPLLQEYVRGMYDEDRIMNQFAKAYGYIKPIDEETDEAAQD